MVVVTSPETRINSMQDLVVLARAKPGELSYATSGNGARRHSRGDARKLHGHEDDQRSVQGQRPGARRGMAGRVNLHFYPIVGIADQERAKRLKVLASARPDRTPIFPAVPTLEQSGFPGFEETAPWWACSLPPERPRRR